MVICIIATIFHTIGMVELTKYFDDKVLVETVDVWEDVTTSDGDWPDTGSDDTWTDDTWTDDTSTWMWGDHEHYNYYQHTISAPQNVKDIIGSMLWGINWTISLWNLYFAFLIFWFSLFGKNQISRLIFSCFVYLVHCSLIAPSMIWISNGYANDIDESSGDANKYYKKASFENGAIGITLIVSAICCFVIIGINVYVKIRGLDKDAEVRHELKLSGLYRVHRLMSFGLILSLITFVVFMSLLEGLEADTVGVSFYVNIGAMLFGAVTICFDIFA